MRYERGNCNKILMQGEQWSCFITLHRQLTGTQSIYRPRAQPTWPFPLRRITSNAGTSSAAQPLPPPPLHPIPPTPPLTPSPPPADTTDSTSSRGWCRVVPSPLPPLPPSRAASVSSNADRSAVTLMKTERRASKAFLTSVVPSRRSGTCHSMKWFCWGTTKDWQWAMRTTSFRCGIELDTDIDLGRADYKTGIGFKALLMVMKHVMVRVVACHIQNIRSVGSAHVLNNVESHERVTSGRPEVNDFDSRREVENPLLVLSRS